MEKNKTMRETFDYVVRYVVDVECVTAFHTGAEELCQRNAKNQPFLQGYSISGAMRNFKEKTNRTILNAAGQEKALFLLPVKELRISDLVFEKTDAIETRSRIAVDGDSGVKKGGAFRYAALPKGTRGMFTIHWMGMKDRNGEVDRARTPERVRQGIENYLSAMNSGLICLGKWNHTGMGQMKLNVRRCEYDLCCADDLRRWLADEEDERITPDDDIVKLEWLEWKKVVFHISFYADGILVRNAHSLGIGSQRTTYSSVKNAMGVYYVPSTVIRGALRHRANYIEKILYPKTLEKNTESCKTGEQKKNNVSVVREMMGTRGTSGVVSVSDGILESCSIRTPEPGGHREERYRAHTDQLTSGSIAGSLVTQESIHGLLKWSVTVPVEKDGKYKRICRLLLFALRDLGLGRYGLGSSGAIGFGIAKAMTVQIRTTDGEAVMKCRDGHIEFLDEKHIVSSWMESERERAE